MGTKLDLMGMSEFTRKFEEAEGPDGWKDLEDALANGNDAMVYVDELVGLFTKTIGRQEDVQRAVVDVSKFVLLMYVMSVVKARNEKQGIFASGDPVRIDMFVRGFKSLLEGLGNKTDMFQEILESVVSVAVSVGIGIALDEGFVLDKEARNDQDPG